MIPALPYLYDEPIEKVTEWGFERIEEKVLGDKVLDRLKATEAVKAHVHRVGEEEELLRKTRDNEGL
jgi:hypothetical protein